MKKLITSILILFAFMGLWQSCIDDESVGIVRELSKIKIEVTQDTFYVDFGVETTIPATVTQTGEKKMTYEWAWGAVNLDDGSIKDSISVISTEPELHYAFRKLGQYRVRLRVSNEDGSSFYYFELYVRTPYQEGVLVLSKDENNVGRTSFLRVKNPAEIVTGTEEFILHGCEGVNPEIELNDPLDITWMKSNLMIISDGGEFIHQFDKTTFDYLNTLKVNQEYPEARLKMICQANPPTAIFSRMLCWGVEGKTWLLDNDMMLVTPDASYSPGEKFDKIYTQIAVKGETNILYVNFEESYINHALGNTFPPTRFTSGNKFEGRYIVNLMADENNRLHVITTDPKDPQSVMITRYNNMLDKEGWFTNKGAFIDPQDNAYRAEQPLTLTRETEMLTNNTYNETFYTRGNELYQWMYKGINLPTRPLLTLDGEITCMSLSPDDKYIFLGIWNPSAEETLKGSIYIYDMETRQIIREYRGVADKPLKIMYKKSN